jgi:glutathione S-transferase
LDLSYTQLPPRPNPHPFNQVPCLVDGPVDDLSTCSPIWESGAILLHIATKYDPNYSIEKHAPWVVFANSALDPICFREDSNGRVLGTSLDKPNKKIAVLEEMLADSDYIVDNKFSVADVAIASYLNYVPLFNGDSVSLRGIPNVVRYMERCAEREKFGGAFGGQHRDMVRGLCGKWLVEGKGGNADKKMFGIF